MREPYASSRLLVQGSWLTEVKNSGFDPLNAAERFLTLERVAELWGSADLAIECACARIVMLDEYANDLEAARAALDAIEHKYEGDVRIVRARARFHFRHDEHVESLRALERVADALPMDDHVERAFACRHGAISAAALNDLPRARRLFGAAYQAAKAVAEEMRPMAAGLMADSAVIEFRLGNREEAVRLLRGALLDIDGLNSNADRQARWCLAILGHAILAMRSEIEESAWSGMSFPMIIGACSNPEPHQDIQQRPVPAPVLLWYLLAGLEADLCVDLGIFGELRARTGAEQIAFYETILTVDRMGSYISRSDVRGFVEYLPEFVAWAAYKVQHRDELHRTLPTETRTVRLDRLTPEDWGRDPYRSAAQDAIVALVAGALSTGVGDVISPLKAGLAGLPGASDALSTFLAWIIREDRQD